MAGRPDQGGERSTGIADAILTCPAGLGRTVATSGYLFLVVGTVVFTGARLLALHPALSAMAALVVAGVASWLSLLFSRARPLTVVIGASSIRVGKRETRFDQIERVVIPPLYVAFPRQVAFKLKMPDRMSVLTRVFRARYAVLPGHRQFKAETIKQLRARHSDIPVEEGVNEFLADAGVRWRTVPWPALLGFGLAVPSWTYMLLVSVGGLAAPWELHLIPFGASFVALASLLLDSDGPEEEPRGKTVLVAIAALVAFAASPLWLIALLHSGPHWAPLVYAAAVGACLGGLVACVPVRLRAWQIAAGTSAVAAALLALTWVLTVHDTLAAERLAIWPPAESAAFSEDGSMLMLWGNGPLRGESGFHVLDVRGSPLVSVAGRPDESFLVAPTARCTAVCCGMRGEERALFAVSASGERKPILAGAFFGRFVTSPDGQRLAFLFRRKYSEDADSAESEGDEDKYRLAILNWDTLQAQPQGLALEDLAEIAWRSDGRFVWAEHPRSLSDGGVREPATYYVKSWAPGEASPRTEFRSDEKWISAGGVSPAFDKIVARVPSDRSQVRRLVRFSDGHSFDVPDIDYGPFWSSDSRFCAIVPEAAPNTLMLVDTQTETLSELHRSSFGHVYWASFSPGAEAVAVSVWQRYVAAAVYVVDVKTKATRRVRPLTLTGLFAVDRQGAAWSPDGKKLVLASPFHPPIRFGTREQSTVWIVNMEP